MKFLRNVPWFILIVVAAGCAQTPKRPELTVHIEPIEWISSSAVLNTTTRSEIIKWLASHPSRDVLLSIKTNNAKTKQSVSELLQTQGINAWQIADTHQVQKPKSSGAIVISGVWLQRRVSGCQHWGCASQHNLMASVADARDVVKGKSLSAPSAERELMALSKYLGRAGSDSPQAQAVTIGGGSEGSSDGHNH